MNRKNKHKKILPVILVLISLLLFGGALFPGIRGQSPETIENPVQGISPRSSMKGYLGKGYAFADLNTDSADAQSSTLAQIPEDTEEQEEEPDSQDEEVTEEPEVSGEPDQIFVPSDESQGDPSEDISDQNQENTVQYEPDSEENNEEEETPDKNDDNSQDGADIPEEDTPTPAPEENRYPTVATDLTDGETVNASYRTFYVQAFDYQGSILSSSSVEVSGNGQKIYSVSTDGEGIIAYRMELTETENTVNIKVTDSEGWTTTLPTYKIYKGEEEADQPAGTINISITAGTVGLGTILPSTPVEFYQGEQLSSVLLRLLDENGFDWRNEGSATSGFYLRSIGRSGLTAGASIPDDLMTHLEAVNSQLTDHDNDWLGEFDFTMDSGWLYFVNGEYMNVGMTGYFPADGDSIKLCFSLYAGADVGSGQNGETWGDWS